MIDLNDDTVILYAIRSYESPLCVKSEFEEDFKRFKYLQRLLQRYRKSKILKDRLILNHLVVIFNTFRADAAIRLLFYYNKPSDYCTLKTFLLYLSRMPEKIEGVRGRVIHSYDIRIDPIIVRALKEWTHAS